jgi:uncharacterized protein
MKIILDTSTILSFLVTKDRGDDLLSALIKKAKIGSIRLYYSDATFQELTQSMKKDKIKSKLHSQTARFIADYKYLAAKVVQINHKVTICRDPNDNMFLEIAKEIQADFIISGDNDLLSLKRFENTRIIKAGDFVEILNKNSSI